MPYHLGRTRSATLRQRRTAPRPLRSPLGPGLGPAETPPPPTSPPPWQATSTRPYRGNTATTRPTCRGWARPPRPSPPRTWCLPPYSTTQAGEQHLPRPPPRTRHPCPRRPARPACPQPRRPSRPLHARPPGTLGARAPRRSFYLTASTESLPRSLPRRRRRLPPRRRQSQHLRRDRAASRAGSGWSDNH